MSSVEIVLGVRPHVSQQDDVVDPLDTDYLKLVRAAAPFIYSLQGRATLVIVEISRSFIDRDPTPHERFLLARAYRSRDHMNHLVNCLCESEAVSDDVLAELIKQYPSLFSRVKGKRDSS